MNLINLFLPDSKNKTTPAGNEVSHIINLFTSFYVKGFLKLGNEVIILTFITATEVVLLIKSGGNEVFVLFPLTINNYHHQTIKSSSK